MKTIGQVYIENVKKLFNSQKELADKTFAQLTDNELHFTPDENTNSIAIQIQHISGNMKSRFTDFFISDGEKPNRNRDEEFQERQLTRSELLATWESSWTTLMNLLNTLKDEDLLKTVYIRSEPHSALDAINRQVNHYAYHVGQIVQLGKLIKKDKWSSLSIPLNQSQAFNDSFMKK
ncbi:DUF1572 family protein [Solitalea lacus]|uniref:DUF1572 family protein n=1 Tax=Solitalea lacus TaxID=2911172 RepID=UPI001EDC637C|nr:DUF1572 family protein [Solitalea lacus]UKJ07587.1 DUF1572 domain-containing protein [Solitalea lacus]